MRLTIRIATTAAVLLALAVPAGAQTPAAAPARAGLMGDLIRDIGQVEKKIVGLAKSLPQSAYDWRPGKGVRSTGEVFMHVAADNYFLPVLMGTAAPAETKITKEYSTAEAFEKRPMTREAVVTELEKSFAFLKTSMNAMQDSALDSPLELFGQKNTNRGLWISTVTHLHEHLGQLIAYSRANNITPPWSK